MKEAKGFTLIELMIVVALIGIISAIAVPQYSQYVIRGNRAAAQAYMMDIASREKQYLLDARAYANSLATLSMTAPVDVSRNYDIIICIDAGCTPATAAPSFKITATPVAGTKQAKDGSLTLDDTGAKCWSVNIVAGVCPNKW